MPGYEAEGFEPPAPVAYAVIRNPARESSLDVLLLIDTGSDVSAVPRSVVTALGAVVRPSALRVRTYDGEEMLCDVTDLRLELLRYRFAGEFVVSDSDYGLLGRNILNSLVLTLNGPRREWSA